ncbi:olfactory receptor 5AN6-like [Discoglossus pictus]
MTLTINLSILLLIISDSQLHSPMYFFLGNLACLDMFYSSVTAPQLLSNFFKEKRSISVQLCITQVFFFHNLGGSEIFLLAVMSYDRYIAICQPLHYVTIISWKVCIQMAAGAWAVGLITSLVHSLCLLRLNFCDSDTINNFFCDLPQVLQLSCTDTFINMLVLFLQAIIFGSSALLVTFIPYIHIFRTVLRIQSTQGQRKALSTCSSHLAVVFIFYGTLLFAYFNPTRNNHVDRVISVIYTLITPLLNPLIYSLRNRDLKGALRRTVLKIINVVNTLGKISN